jgi:hypothetical protein
MVDRDPLRTLAGMALQGDKSAPGAALEAILDFAWDQLCQRYSTRELRAVLLKNEFFDLYELAAEVIADNPTHHKEA